MSTLSTPSTVGAPNPQSSAEFVQSLERGLSVICVFDATHPRLSLSDAARRAGLSRATARRILHTLAALGYVTGDGKWFELTPKVLDLGYAYLSSLQVGDIAQPFMEELSERVEESVSVGVLDGADIVYVARVPTKRILRMALGLGSRLPALTTSIGRVLVADLPIVQQQVLVDAALGAPPGPFPPLRHTARQLLRVLERTCEQGYALVDQELESGLRSVAAPLRDRNGRVVAAMNVSTTVDRVPMDRLVDEVLPALLGTAASVSALLGKR